METESFKKGDFLVKEGEKNINTYFIISGCVRQYKLVDGEEITTNFFTEDHWIIALGNFISENLSNYSLICMEDTTIVKGNEQKAQELFRHFPRFETISRAVMEHVFAEQQTFMTTYLTDSPEERYRKLLKSRPDLFQRVPQYHIASYLGVKPESLSRIRNRISKDL